MKSLELHPFHSNLNARFAGFGGAEAVASYGDVQEEHAALRQSAGILDLSYRGRLCLTGTDRIRFLHGQVTNDVNALKVGEGCYAALITAKGKMVSDLDIYRLEDELLLDFEPGLSGVIAQRLEHYIISDDVQVVDAAPDYGLLTVQGPKADEVLRRLDLASVLPSAPRNFVCLKDSPFGQLYVMHRPRLRTRGFDLFVPSASMPNMAGRLSQAASETGGRFCGWEALEIARVEAGIPRFGLDMDESTLPPEAGLEAEAISYTKGCYIGQEVISRIRAYGQVAKTLRGLVLSDGLPALPKNGDKLLKNGKEVGFVTSAVVSPTGWNSDPMAASGPSNIALGYVRREANAIGTELTLRTAAGESSAKVVALPGHVSEASPPER